MELGSSPEDLELHTGKRPAKKALTGWLTALNTRLSRWTMYVACICLAGLLIVVVYGVVLRYVFNDAPPYVEQVALLLVISVAMFGASAGVRDAGHIGMDSLVMVLPQRVQFWCEVVVFVLSICFALALLAGGAEMATSTRNDTIPTLGISEAVRYAPIMIAGVLITLFSIEHLIALFAGKRGGPIMALTILCLSFVLFLLLGLPVAFAIGLSCIATFAVEGLPYETAIQMMTSGMNVFSFLAIPFFIFSGELMLHGGIADKIVNFARSLVGHWRGGLGLANVLASTLFGGVSGSPVADTSAMGGVMIPIMKREGYSAAYAVNVTTHASLSGALMPTSHNMIIYAFAAQAATGMINGHVVKGVSIGDLMFAGLVPCFWIMVCMLIAAYWQAVKYGYPKSVAGKSMVEKFPGWNAVLRTFIASVPGLMVVLIILVCVMKGITTATEAAAIAVTYSLILTVFIYRTMSRKNLIKSLAKASKTTGVILLLIGVSNMLRYQMAYLEIPDAIESALLTATTMPWLMLLYINIIQIILGIFLDMAAHILITTPLFLPLAIQMGVGPVQFGMMLLLNCALGLVHPPVGTVQFVGCAIGNISIGEATKTAWPYYLAILTAITLVTYVPIFSTWLPSVITGHPVL